MCCSSRHSPSPSLATFSSPTTCGIGWATFSLLYHFFLTMISKSLFLPVDIPQSVWPEEGGRTSKEEEEWPCLEPVPGPYRFYTTYWFFNFFILEYKKKHFDISVRKLFSKFKKIPTSSDMSGVLAHRSDPERGLGSPVGISSQNTTTWRILYLGKALLGFNGSMGES